MTRDIPAKSAYKTEGAAVRGGPFRPRGIDAARPINSME
jgi:hypothetical protein